MTMPKSKKKSVCCSQEMEGKVRFLQSDTITGYMWFAVGY